MIPYAIEYAKTGRASCKGCKCLIPQGDLRVSVRANSYFFDGVQDNWFHFKCFWRRFKKNDDDINEASIAGLENLKWDDQEETRKYIARNKEGWEEADPTKPRLEYNSRGKCKECKRMIKKKGLKFMVGSTSYHINCYKKLDESAITDIESVFGFNDLNEEDMNQLKDLFKKPKGAKAKRKGEAIAEEPPEKIQKADEAGPSSTTNVNQPLKDQSDKIWSVRKCLEDNFDSEALRSILRANQQQKPAHNTLDRVVDCLVFGCPEKCQRCGGHIEFSAMDQTYKCQGYASAYTKCEYTSLNPPRKEFECPKEMLKKFKKLPELKFEGIKDRVYSELSEKPVQPYSFVAIRNRQAPWQWDSGGDAIPFCYDHIRVKDGAVVDPQFESCYTSHVYKDKQGTLWHTVLSSTDITQDKNSFYKLQIIQHDNQEKFWLFRAWGRIGSIRRSTQVECFKNDVANARVEFERLFLEKTGNQWSNRDGFAKIPGKMCLLEADVFEVPEKWAEESDSKSKLHKSVQDVIRLIFDVKAMKNSYVFLKLDGFRMPLGQLTERQIRSAYGVLTELQQLISCNDATPDQFLDATNRFYTFIPHICQKGSNLPRLDNAEIIKEKVKMLDELLEIETAYSILNKTFKANIEQCEGKSLADALYERLHTELEVLREDTEEYKRIVQYFKERETEQHCFKRELIDVFRVHREGEAERFKKHMPNRYMLWHGSRSQNFASILSKGLKLPTAESPAIGYFFGKGIYFADMASKSVNYCDCMRGAQLADEVMILLCEVALGEVQEERFPKCIEELENGKHSIKGLGRVIPDPKGAFIDEEGVIMPLGAPVDAGRQDVNMLHNEYIVFDESQIQIKYLVRFRMLRP